MTKHRPGYDLTIGMLLPSGNLVAECQMLQMLAPRVALYTTRLPLTGSSEAQLNAMIDNLEGAARLLADARVISCTAIESADVIEELERELGKPVLTSNQALAWHCQRSGGVQQPVPGFGALLAAAQPLS